MIVDGKKIAADIFDSLKIYIQKEGVRPHLTVLTASPDFATKKFLALKERRAHEIGVTLEIIDLGGSCTTDAVISAIKTAVPHTDGIIVQLPFPPDVDMKEVLEVLPADKDIDAIGHAAVQGLKDGTVTILPPVVAAIRAISKRERLSFTGTRVVVVGRGRLVGAPAATWFRSQGAEVITCDRNSKDMEMYTQTADVLVLGAGVPKFITPNKVKAGVVIFDAGTSEDAGELSGDADPACADKATLFTPVPGGIGPITVAALFANLLQLRYGLVLDA